MKKTAKEYDRLELIREMEKTLPYKRFIHTMGVAAVAAGLAMRHGEDVHRTEVAGILHDCAKKLSAEEMIRLCEKGDIPVTSVERKNPALLHAGAGCVLANQRYGIADEEILGAIRWHTTGKPDMSLFEKILYLADYIEPTRDFEGIDELRELAFTDLDGAMVLGLGMTIDEIRRSGHEPYIDTLEAYAWYKEKEK
jgi:predicted HD superfamily hydrolase involved in NAD metabolism